MNKVYITKTILENKVIYEMVYGDKRAKTTSSTNFELNDETKNFIIELFSIKEEVEFIVQ